MQPTPRRTVPLSAAFALACLLLLTQTLGLMHGVLHHPTGPHTVQSPQVHAVDTLAHWIADHDEGDASCVLLDQLGHGDALLMATSLARPVLLAVASVCTRAVPIAQTRFSAYRSRAPPLPLQS